MQRLREYIQDELTAITASEITRMLKTRFQIEQFSQYFSIRPYHFSGSAISMSADENILLEFPTLKSDYPQYYQSSHYRMLLVLSIADVVDFNATVLQDIDHIAQGENIDQIVIWTRRNLDRSVSDVLKHHRATVIKIADSELSEVDQLTNFVFNAGVDSDKLIALNFIADLLVKRLKKLFHFVLSEIAAPIYDLKYGKAKVATNRLMKREETELRHIVDLVAPEPTETSQSSPATRIAVDVGCGTGRHSFDLAKRFSKVYAFDFSSRMIDQAREKKKGLDNRNIVFSTADLEYEEVDGEQDFSGNADLVVASFGMASFVENTSRMLRRFYTWLKPGGRLFLSFYNANSVLDVMTPNWRDTSLSAHLDKQRRTLRVELSKDMVFYIYCKPFDADILKQISSFFEIEKRFNYPTIMAMLPNSMLENPDAVQFIEHIDDLLSGDERFPYGYYTFLCCRKSEQINPAQTDIHRILSDKGIQFELIEHKPVLTLREVRQVLEIDEASMVKTVVLTEGKRRNIRPEEKHYIVVAVKGNRQVDTDVVAEALSSALGRSISRGRIDFASRSDLFWLGYPLGGVGPFAINAPKITLMIDAELRASRKKYAYMGSGGNTKTLKMLMRDFKDLTKDYVEIACRDKEPTG